ncbi:hypothetical protein LR48_Vigan08g175300 [Vigna angularis]|uniref:Uncharacterized protein n=2 Tax=Phaseolus angularis TaxID=3914 RepID=A0A0L9V788_PHAAN|nr:uncharacterized protein HKW66_Vig0138380 [Vigna angularis]KOM50926.1 hypothetical protein LR48_Vigan08g175300 [Vigna angularis]BAT90962.1 hypothetical protein VIGAN_06226100 [Vigna angularis var. angularis]
MACLQPPWFSSLRVAPPTKLAGPPSASLKPAKQLCWALGPDNTESSEPSQEAPTGPLDPVKLAFSKAQAYKKSNISNSGLGTTQGADDDNSVEKGNVGGEGQKDLPDSVKIAMEKAKKYKQNKGVADSETTQTQGSLGGSERSSGGNVMDDKVGKKGELSVSKMDFVGLDFADKKTTRGLPPGLVPISDPFFDDELPEVELIVGDTSKFGDAMAPEPEQANEDEAELYKPKVSTWGVFPRPANISKTFGGGRVIRPGDVLETEEEKAAKEARTKQLLAAYKKKMGLNIDPKLKSECEETLKDGDLLMNEGKLNEALSYYEKVMDKLTFESELHGLAALQWSICQDSLSRSNEARSMYEKLLSHPNPKVSKKARQFMYSFQAMEMMKVSASSPFYLKNTGYQNYFDAFVEKKSNYPQEDDLVQESAMNQVVPYILFLLSPIFIVLLVALKKGI